MPSIIAYVILCIIALFYLLPFTWLVVSSFNPTASFSLEMPSQFSLANFSTIFSSGLVVRPFTNSLILAVSTMVLAVVLSGLAAYPLSRYPFRGKKILMYVILFASGLPVLALVTPLFAMYVQFNLTDTFYRRDLLSGGYRPAIQYLADEGVPGLRFRGTGRGCVGRRRLDVPLFPQYCVAALRAGRRRGRRAELSRRMDQFLRAIHHLPDRRIICRHRLTFTASLARMVRSAMARWRPTRCSMRCLPWCCICWFRASSFAASIWVVSKGDMPLAPGKRHLVPRQEMKRAFSVGIQFTLPRHARAGQVRRRYQVRAFACLLVIGLTGCGCSAFGTAAQGASLPRCTPVIQQMTSLPARVDSLLVTGNSGPVVALTAASHGGAAFLPLDNLLVISGSHAFHLTRIVLPSYITPPGLASTNSSDPGTVYIVLDQTLWVLDVSTGHIVARQSLGVQANGWPAAVVAGSDGRLFIIGQPLGAGLPAANVEELAVSRTRPPHVLWRARLGYYHAGIWLGLGGAGRLVVYVPGTYDTPGSVELLNSRDGTLITGYRVPAPPVAVDPTHNRLYVDDAGLIRAFVLSNGQQVATLAGAPPVVVDASRDLVAFIQHNTIVMAEARSLLPRAHIAVSGPVTALATTPDGAKVVAGLKTGLAWIDLKTCVQ